MKHLFLKTSLGTFTLLFSPIVFSGVGTMTYTTQSAVAIPTLNGVMLLLLSLLLVVIAFRMTKQKNTHASKLFLTLLSVGVLSSGTVGVHLISKANANGGGNIPLTSSGSVAVAEGDNNYLNSLLSYAVSITAIDVDTGFTCTVASSGDLKCTVGLTLPSSFGKCKLSCTAD